MRNAAQEAAPSAKPFPSVCNQCPVDAKLAGHWSWSKANNRWVCKQYISKKDKEYRARVKSDPAKYKKAQESKAAYGIANALRCRITAYKSEDKRKGHQATISTEQAIPLMEKPCSYCEIENSGGLDRVDNTRGHLFDNVVPCCVKCNGILIDLPYAAKKLLAPGLKEARLAGYLDNWLPPQLRKNGIRS